MTAQTRVKINNIKQFVLLTIFLTLGFVGCSSNRVNEYSVEQFTNDMRSKKYDFVLKDVEKDFLPTTRKRLIFGTEAIEIYIYKSSKSMEKDSKRIDSNGCGYSNGFKSVYVSWIYNVYFYKKGNIIVQYTGENEKIISDLRDILGEQFAGHRTQNNEANKPLE